MIVKPFGPEIYKTKLTEESRKKLETIILENVNKPDKKYNKYLVGYVNKEVDILNDIKNDVLKELHGLVIEYLNNTNSFVRAYSPINQRDIFCTASWGNIQEINEFNPIHNHPTCDIVCVTFPKIDIQSKNPYITNNEIKPGSLLFSYGDGSNFFENSSHVIEPVTGDVYVFPAMLKHGTSPIFSSNDIRISTSTNFCFSEYFSMRVNPITK